MTFLGTVHRKRMAAGPTTLILDEFTDADQTYIQDHIPNIDIVGNGWSSDTTFLRIMSNTLARVAGSATYGCVIDSGQANGILKVKVQPSGGSLLGPIFRASDISNNLSAQMRFGNAVWLQKRTAGSFGLIEEISYPYTDGLVYNMEVEMNGTNIIIRMNDVEIYNDTVSDYSTNTSVGVVNRQSNGYIDDFEMSTLS